MIQVHGTYPFDMEGTRGMGSMSADAFVRRLETDAPVELLEEHIKFYGRPRADDPNMFMNKGFICIDALYGINDVALALYKHDFDYRLISIPLKELKKKAAEKWCNPSLKRWVEENGDG